MICDMCDAKLRLEEKVSAAVVVFNSNLLPHQLAAGLE